MSKSIEIKIEVERELVIETRRVLFCVECGMETQMLFVDEAALAIGSNSGSIFIMIENGSLHSAETKYGLLLDCANSFALAVRQKSIEIEKK